MDRSIGSTPVPQKNHENRKIYTGALYLKIRIYDVLYNIVLFSSHYGVLESYVTVSCHWSRRFLSSPINFLFIYIYLIHNKRSVPAAPFTMPLLNYLSPLDDYKQKTLYTMIGGVPPVTVIVVSHVSSTRTTKTSLSLQLKTFLVLWVTIVHYLIFCTMRWIGLWFGRT